uniref:Uncharacterized protein n=1 Tax=Arundo donax TaxID=35708 RepID=A0A0A8Z4B4_ARUDO
MTDFGGPCSWQNRFLLCTLS